ncbi:vesicle-associated membrane protein 5 [Haplochromis burtoni]|uniref:vesicle-associated membrane protein 5 n=1 Tax=Haplochromis burtoni TaxID=8153 RepID=UPI0003BDAC79|nr:vesicle-associated membrane protein 5 [Haplochromis burtoni]
MDSENGKSHLQKTQEEVEEVKVIMLQNMNKAEERSGKLNELEDRADLLLEESKKFEKTSTQVKTQKRWANKKMKVMLIAVAVVAGLIILSLIIVAIVQSTKGSD